MRIVIDMQGAQTQSRFRGIGRYTMGLAKAIARNRGEHEVILALNGMLPESIDDIRAAFEGLLPHENIRVWYAPGPLAWSEPNSERNREIAEIIHARFIESLEPDEVLFSSLFDIGEELICAPSKFLKKRILNGIIYDFIPLGDKEKYLATQEAQKWYFSRLNEIKSVDTLLCISEYTSLKTKKLFPQKKITSISSDTDQIFTLQKIGPKIKNRIEKEFILYSGGVDERKNVDALVLAYRLLPKRLRDKHQLVIVCGPHQNLRTRLDKKIRALGLSTQDVRTFGYLSDEDLCELYSRCKLFVFPSIEEGFGLPVLEAMRCGAPVIGSNTTSIPEVIGMKEALFDPSSIHSISKKIEQALIDDLFLQNLRKHSQIQQSKFSWDESSKKTISLLESKTSNDRQKFSQTTKEILTTVCSDIVQRGCVECNKFAISQDLARTFEDQKTPQQIFIDISELARVDSGTGIQRVTRSVLGYLLQNPPENYVVRPVYATPKELGYRYAHEFLKQTFDFDDGQAEDNLIEYSHRDFFLGLDLQSAIVPQQKNVLQKMHRHGVRIYFVVYDLIPVLLPNYVRAGNEFVHHRWLSTIKEFDGAMCISQTVATDLRQWMKENAPKRKRPFDIQWFHLGSDIENSVPSKGMPADAEKTLAALRCRPTFLMVSTVEARKGYAQALAAFELLWKENLDVNLVIVGREGWNVSKLIRCLKRHPQKSKHLFWLKGISDEYLDAVYDASTAVLMASEAEGFGLAVVEGARHGKPLILRDLPVFREIAGDNAFYFKGLDATDLATAICQWLDLDAECKVPSPGKIHILSWEKSVQMLIERLPLN